MKEQEQEQEQEQGWFKIVPGNSVAIFIHGLMSNRDKCWKDKNDMYWPNIISNDARLGNLSIYLAEYFTDISSGDFDFSECAKQVLTDLTSQDEKLRPPPLKYSNIIFIAHSAGGVISRAIVEKNRTLFKDKKIGFFLIASPSLGSKYNFITKFVARAFQNSLINELYFDSPYLRSLDEDFRDLLVKQELHICGKELYEHKKNIGNIIAFSNRKVVDKESARRYFGAGVMIPNSDHSTICKPSNTQHQTHKELCKFISDNFTLTIENDHSYEQCNATIKKPPDPLFTKYEPQHEPFYHKRDIDNQLEQMFHRFSIWVCGESGVGKTVSIQRALSKNNINYKFISMARSVKESTNQMLTDLLNELNNYECITTISKSHTLKLISEKIKSLSNDGYSALFIEEIPINNQEQFMDFSESIFSIISTLDSPNINCQIILSSIFEPPNMLGTEFEKTSEKIKILRAESWSIEELNHLSVIIENHLGISLLKDVKDYTRFSGSPRAMKTYYQDYIFNNSIERAS